MNRKKWLQKIATFMLAGTLILQPASISSMSLMPMTVAAAESGNQGEVEKEEKEEEKKAPDKGNASEEKKDAAAGKDTDDKKSDDSGQRGESASKTESDSAGQKNEDKKQSSSDVKNEDKEKKEENKEKETGTENKEEEGKKEETEKEKEEKQKDNDEKKTEKEDKKEDKEEKEKNAGEKKTEENDPAVDAENAAKAAGQDHKKEENKEEEENQNSDKAEKAADDGKTGENTTDAAESQNALERLGETLDKTILQAPLLRGNNNQGKKKLIIYITAKNKEVPYDGKEHIVQQYEVKYKVGDGDATETAPEGVSVTLKDNKARRETEAGTYTFTLSKDQFEFEISGDYNFNHGNALNISTEEKYLLIKRAEYSVTITGNTDSLTYNGKEQSVSGYNISIPKGAPFDENDLSGPEQSAAVATGKDVKYENGNVVSYPMGLKKEDFSYKGNNKNITVEFAVTDGWLKITPAPLVVKIKGKTLTRVYNGTNKESIDGYDFDIPDGVKFEGSEIICDPFPVAEGIDVKYDKDKNIVSYPMGLTVSNFSTDNTNYNVTFEVEDGWLMIEPLEVTVK